MLQINISKQPIGGKSLEAGISFACLKVYKKTNENS